MPSQRLCSFYILNNKPYVSTLLIRYSLLSGVRFKSLIDAIDTGMPSDRSFFYVMASLAEVERKLTVESTRQDWKQSKNHKIKFI
ncbi:hypothetical protein XBP1_1510019 [Xenorhabdus bovienii str. puntauvense]|uniref:Resolvase/invertase-type recombinase catalytic domain-containing protein n=2 Tax=Xenorhabdus bovienii TaxID=40576 RepID=A0A077N9N7_XENBV|nr:hypothetical protein XBP1_1510019 [Xenorhabdus bovienii str. puntauvense]CDH26657.1 hypothetical protein XBKB1_850015 [Xenorhabdus bovienii str. kraussei Becker Underwood]